MTTNTVSRIIASRAEWDARRDHELAYDWPGVDGLLVQIEDPDGARSFECYDNGDDGRVLVYRGDEFPEAIACFM